MTSRIVVLGGGVSGLSTAYYLASGMAINKMKHELILIEKDKLGGWMQTHNAGEGKGIFELGPRTMRIAGFTGQHTLGLADDLGLAEDIISVKASDNPKQNRYIYVNKKLHALPSDWKGIFTKIPPLSTSIAWTYLKGLRKMAPDGSETIHDVVSAKFGEEITKYYVDAIGRGVFAADIKELSLKAAFPHIWKALKPRDGKMPRKPQLLERVMLLNELGGKQLLADSKQQRWTQWNLDGGLSTFIDALEKGCKEKGVNVIKNAEVHNLKLQENGKVTIGVDLSKISNDETAQKNKLSNFDDGTLTDIDAVVSTIPSHNLNSILKNDVDSENSKVFDEISFLLDDIKSVDVGLVNLEFEGRPQEILPHFGFGHLVPSCEESKVLGIVYDSCVFPDHDRKDFPTTRLTCMMGGSWFQQLFGDPESVEMNDLEQIALESVSEQLGINSEPTTVLSKLCRKCIPTYRIGHTDLVEDIEDILEENNIPLFLGGASYWGVSIADCIYNGRFVAKSVLEKLYKDFSE